MYKIFAQSGHTLIELIVALGILALALPALLTGLALSAQNNQRHDLRQQAQQLLLESQEAIRAIRSTGWASVSTPGVYHPEFVSGEWSLVPGSSERNGYTTSVTISEVRRSLTGEIVQTGGWVDPSTLQVQYDVVGVADNAVSLSTQGLLTRYLNNETYTETTEADFSGSGDNTGNTVGTHIIGDGGGEVLLDSTSNADWCQPQDFVIDEVSLPKLSNVIYARQGGAYLGSGDGVNNSPAFINVSVDTPAPPASPSATVVGAFNGSFVTNAIYSDGAYVYLATSSSPQIRILSLQTNPYTEIGTVTIPGGAPANGVYLSSNNNVLFATSGQYLYSFNVTNKSGPHTTVKDSIRMRAGLWSQPTARQVHVVGNRAYVGTGDSLLGLQTFSFNSDGSNLRFVAAALLTFSQQSQGLYVDPDGHYAYIAFNNASGISFSRGMVVVDLTKTSWLLLTYYPNSYTYDTGGMDPRGITVPTNNRAVVVGLGSGTSKGSEQYQVVDTSGLGTVNPPLVYCGGYVVPDGIFGVSSILDQYNAAYSYIITGGSNNQFRIIRGGDGGGGFLSSGTFESKIFDPLFASAFNSFSASVVPNNQTIKMQVAVAAPGANGCTDALYTYAGPNGVQGASPSAYFIPTGGTIEGAMPFGVYDTYVNPQRCFRYKVFFETSDIEASPMLTEFELNYSP